MSSKWLIALGGLGLLAYLLMKPKEEKAEIQPKEVIPTPPREELPPPVKEVIPTPPREELPPPRPEAYLPETEEEKITRQLIGQAVFWGLATGASAEESIRNVEEAYGVSLPPEALARAAEWIKYIKEKEKEWIERYG